ncbi:hypothetical protein [Pseudonocardia broussonetiae]|uniref:Uncharacterized protein n=1 Tax=Pseudonocardia broussonetiae TaxID=2736640 RepID=A0A6M6JLK4_9PSEU|nr:hypothetical protein [Pseudonocardia broussonetiae]QJY47940.1 hypothetical protein HOP40_20830 [Pseudonocardia broussonetiae]
MSSSGAVRFFVDIDALEDIGREIRSLLDALGDGGSRPSTDDGVYGGHDVAHAVRCFLGAATRGRDDVVEQLQACAQLVDLAAREYAATESALSCQLAPASGVAP